MNGFTNLSAATPLIGFNAAPVFEPALVLTSVAGWAVEINALLVQGRKSTMQLARTVHAAKARLPYGCWTAIWKSGQVPFSKRKAEMLAVIGKNLGWADVQTFAHLPSGWSILYHLARLDQAVFRTLLEQGAIHPALTLLQAKDSLAASRGLQSVARKPNLLRRLKRFRDFARAHLCEWAMEERDQARAELRRLSDELGGVDMIPQDAAECSNKNDNTQSRSPLP
ncbi:MAG TPA: hypothetical protein VIW67_27520 [Terriglobales bacterium]